MNKSIHTVILLACQFLPAALFALAPELSPVNSFPETHKTDTIAHKDSLSADFPKKDSMAKISIPQVIDTISLIADSNIIIYEVEEPDSGVLAVLASGAGIGNAGGAGDGGVADPPIIEQKTAMRGVLGSPGEPAAEAGESAGGTGRGDADNREASVNGGNQQHRGSSSGRAGKAHKKVIKTQYGVASFYSNKFEGRRTYTDEIFSQKKLTAASNTLPMHVWVKVTNLRNHRTVVLRINDKMHPKNRRLIDLSRAAAQKLGYTGHGLARVRVDVLGKKKPAGVETASE